MSLPYCSVKFSLKTLVNSPQWLLLKPDYFLHSMPTFIKSRKYVSIFQMSTCFSISSMIYTTDFLVSSIFIMMWGFDG